MMNMGIGGVLLAVVIAVAGFAIWYLVIKAAVHAGIKAAYSDLAVYLKSVVTAGVKEALEDREEKK